MTLIQPASDPLQNFHFSKWSSVKACRICLATDCKLCAINEHEGLQQNYNTLTGLSAEEQAVHLPSYLCLECAQRLFNCAQFRMKSLQAHETLREITKKYDFITSARVKSVHRRFKSDLGVSHRPPDHCDLHVRFGGSPPGVARDVPERDSLSDDDWFNGDWIDDELWRLEEPAGEPSSASGSTRGKRRRTDKSKNDKGLKQLENKRGRKRKLKEDEERAADSDGGAADGERAAEEIKQERGVRKNEMDSEEENVCDGKRTGDPNSEGNSAGERLLLDRSMFSVTDLTLEQQIREVQERQRCPSYQEARYKCTVCYRGYDDKHHYKTHLQKHDEASGDFECVVCRVRTKSHRALSRHMAGIHLRQYSCNLCPFVSRNSGATKKHQKFHSGVVYQCPHCPIIFKQYSTYQNHLRIKHASRHACAFCGYTFANEKGLAQHRKIKHRAADEDFAWAAGPPCDQCGVTFVSAAAYERHLKLSSEHCSDDDPRRISNDPQVLGVRKLRRKMVKIPTEQRRVAVRKRSPGRRRVTGPVSCEQCGVELPNMRTYAKHFQYEHPDKNRTQFPRHYSYAMCELCGHVANCNSLLMSHMWTRHGVGDWRPPSPLEPPIEKPVRIFVCPMCGKVSKSKSNFQRHLFKHTGQRPFKCDLCPKCFTTRTGKRLHMNHVHFKKPWPKRIRPRRERRPAADAGLSSDDEDTKQRMLSYKEEHLVDNYKEENLVDDYEEEHLVDNYKEDNLVDNYKEENLVDDYEEEHLVDDYVEEHLVDDYEEEHLVDDYKEEHLVDDYKEEHLVDDYEEDSS